MTFIVSFSSQMLLLALYIPILKPGTGPDFFILPLLFLLFLYAFLECPRPLLGDSSSRSGTEPLHYIACLHLPIILVVMVRNYQWS